MTLPANSCQTLAVANGAHNTLPPVKLVPTCAPTLPNQLSMLLNWTVPGGRYSGLKVLPAPLGRPSVSTLVLEWMKLPDGSKNQLLPRSIL